MISGVLFDLENTLFPEFAWLDGAWETVARAAAAGYGVEPRLLRAALSGVAAEGTARERIIETALARIGAVGVPVAPLVEAFRSHRPQGLSCYPGARKAVAELRAVMPVGLVTDGDVEIQRRKVRLLGLDGAFDVVVFSDELGPEFRKPHPRPFLAALEQLGSRVETSVHVGDHPVEDVDGAVGAGLRPVRVLSGEHANAPSAHEPWAVAQDVAHAARLILAAHHRADPTHGRGPGGRSQRADQERDLGE